MYRIAIGILAVLVILGLVVFARAAREAEGEAVHARPMFAATELTTAILPAEVRFQAAAYIDDNRNGIGEFAFISELSGLASVSATAPSPAVAEATDATWSATSGTVTLALLPPTFQADVPADEGYRYAIYLPDGPAGAISDPYPLHARGDPAKAALRETRWIAYAWPADASEHLLFAITESGELYVHDTRSTADPTYPANPTPTPPAWNALFTRDAVPGEPPPTPGTWGSPVSPDWKLYRR
jgi:hypothetical protein